eukprot:3051118-Amphidinium_carterae.1
MICLPFLLPCSFIPWQAATGAAALQQLQFMMNAQGGKPGRWGKNCMHRTAGTVQCSQCGTLARSSEPPTVAGMEEEKYYDE